MTMGRICVTLLPEILVVYPETNDKTRFVFVESITRSFISGNMFLKAISKIRSYFEKL